MKIGSEGQRLDKILPIIAKASPRIHSIILDNTQLIFGILAAIFNCDPYNIEELISKLEKDEDLFSKLANLEKTHAEWLNNFEYNISLFLTNKKDKD